jgi:hypothetical protein
MLPEQNLAIRVTLLVLTILLTFRYSSRGLQNGVLLLLIGSLLPMYQGTLIRGDSFPNITIDRVVCVVVLVVFVQQWRRRQIKRYKLDLTEYGMLTFTIVLFLNMYLHNTLVLAGKLQFFTVLSGFLIPFTAYFTLRRAALSEAQAKSFLTGVGIITVYLGLTGVGEIFQQSWLVFPEYILNPKIGIHFGKVRGPFVQASWNGLAMAMGLPILLWLLLWKRDTRRWVWAAGMLLVCLSLPYVAQRAAWLSAAAALGIVVLTWPIPRYLLKTYCLLIGVVLMALPVAAIVLPEEVRGIIEYKLSETGNIEYRYMLIEASRNIIVNNVFTGIGFGRFYEDIMGQGLDANFSSHNMVLTLFAEIGLVGLLPYLFIYGRLFLDSAKAYCLLPGSRMIIGTLWAITAAHVVMSMAVELSIVLYPNLLLFALWGIFLPIVRQQFAVQPARIRFYGPIGLYRHPIRRGIYTRQQVGETQQ